MVRNLSRGLCIATAVSLAAQVSALTVAGGGSRGGALFVYVPAPTDSTTAVPDSSGSGTALNLTIPDATLASKVAGVLHLNGSTFIGASAAASTKLLNAVAGSQAISIEAWIKPATNTNTGLARIVTYSIDTGNRNFSLGQSNGKYFVRLRTADNTGNASSQELDSPDGSVTTSLSHVVFTRTADGTATLYVNGVSVATRTITGQINNWDATYRFGIGNEVTNDRVWNGDVALVAVYNRALTEAEATGLVVEPGDKLLEPAANETDQDRALGAAARRLYARLAGLDLPLDHPTIVQMRDLLGAGKKIDAAALATATDSFYNITVRQFASKMATKEETPQAPLGDFVSTVIGVARDGTSAQELLTGDYVYQGDPAKVPGLPMDVTSLFASNAHFDFLDAQRADLAQVLVKVPQQISTAGGVVASPDPAGVITGRQYAEAHFTAGTNRRPVAYVFREFMCLAMEEWADASRTDAFVGRDVDRAPGGDIGVYATKCKSCHAAMDGFRGAFARWDFRGGTVMNALLFPAGSGDGQMPQNPAGIAAKLNGNNTVFPGGRTTTDDSFVLFANSPNDQKIFGWKSEPTPAAPAHGTKEFGRMIANSDRFPYCMAKRVFKDVCRRDPASDEESFIQALGADFKASDYKLKELFERVAVAPPCLGM